MSVNVLPSETYPFGYCTNVHAGTTLEQAKANLLKFASPIQQQVCSPTQPALPVGLWLAEDAAIKLDQTGETEGFHEWLHQHHFAAYTFNGFPQGDFHQPVVKHEVYQPTWQAPERLEYTLRLARILSQLIPEGATGSISTLPLGWPHETWGQNEFQSCAEHLLALAEQLEELHEITGREIVVAIEPEPGCILNTAPEMATFFENYLFSNERAEAARRHLSICHDICHSGVMFEPQPAALECYLDAGIRVGKVQVSSAVHIPWDSCQIGDELGKDMLAQIQTLNEPKYLHQAARQATSGELDELCEDISVALSGWLPQGGPAHTPQLPWRVHFHVPIFVEKFGCLETTRADIPEATKFLEANRKRQIAGRDWFTGHYEVETYAWPVLPEELSEPDLSAGISKELQYFARILRGLA